MKRQTGKRFVFKIIIVLFLLLAGNMPVLTKQLGFPPSFDGCGIGLWTDRQQNRTYFYSTSVPSSSGHSDIFRIRIDDSASADCEFVGTVDFHCYCITTSVCENFFWSINARPPLFVTTDRRQLILRKVNFRTLKYEVFQMPGRLTTDI